MMASKFLRKREVPRTEFRPKSTVMFWDTGKVDLPPCANCLIPFSYGSDLEDTSQLPHILHCNHSVCEKCLLKELTRKNKIFCGTCRAPSTCPPGMTENEVRKLYPYNHYYIGLAIDKNLCFVDEDSLFFKHPQNVQKPVITKCNDCGIQATIRCIDCAVPYCDRCDNSVHILSALKIHKRVDVKFSGMSALALLNEELKGCQVHLQKFEFYCGQCEESACSRCLLAKHNGHTGLKEIRDENAEKRDDLLESFAKLTNIKNSLENSSQKLAGYIANSHLSDKIKKTEHQINNHFSMIHTILINLQFKMIEKLKDDKNINEAKKLMKTISESSEEIDGLLHFASKLLKEGENSNFNFEKCIDALRQKFSTRCHLHTNFEDDENQPYFTFNDQIISILNEHCEVKIPKTRFSLLSDSEIPVSFTRDENIPEISKEDIEAYLRRSVKKVPRQTNAPTVPISGPGFVDFCPADGLEPNIRISVSMSHIVSPEEFYIHRIGTEKKLETINQTISKFVKTESTLPMSRVLKGHLYSVLYKGSTWYRARITKFEDEAHVKVQYIDYGSTETIPIKALRQIPPHLNTSFMGHAIRCYLHNCYPISDQWDKTVVTYMIKILNDENAIVYIHKKEDHVLQVSLYCPAESGYYNNMSEALNFLGLSKFGAEDVCPHQFDSKVLYKELPRLSSSTTFEASIVHVINPSSFYIVDEKPYDRKRYIAMEKELQAYYKNRMPSTFNVFHPHIGMPLAAFFGEKWHRSEVTGILNDQKISASLVDTGETVELSWQNVKILNKRFTELPKRAIHSSLDEIEPKEAIWCNKSIEKLKSYMGMLLRVVVGFHDETLCVILHYLMVNKNLCINASFVQDNLAISTGPNSKNIQYEKYPSLREGVKTVESTKKCATILKTQVPAVDDIDIARSDDGLIKVRVIPQFAKDPSEFYVTLSYSAYEIERLEAEMDVEYSKDHWTSRIEDWKVGDYCAVKLESWKRGIVKNVNSDYTVEVYLCETGSSKVIDMDEIRPLICQFMNLKDGAFRCHLGGLTPSSEKWSGIAITLFNEFLNDNALGLYITQMDEDEHITDSTPVELFIKQIVDRGPLELPLTTWWSLNHYLFMQGYAKSDGDCAWNSLGRVLKPSEIQNLLDSKADLQTEDHEENLEKGTNGNDVDPEPEVVGQEGQKSWKPPMKLEHLSFEGCATHIDQEGLFIQSYSENCPVVEKMTLALDQRYGASNKNVDDEIVEVGAPCSAKFFSNKSWYRATIVKVSNFTEVKYVDFGTKLLVSHSEIRKPLFLDIPIQLNHCKWYKIKPIGPMFSDNALDEISALILEKKSKITLVELPDGTYGVDQFELPNGQDFFELLVKRELAVYKHEFKPKESQENIEEENTEDIILNNKYTSSYFWGVISGSGRSFKTYKVPKLSTSLNVRCSAVLSETQVMLELCNGPREINRHNYHFSLFEQVLNDEGPSMDFLKQPYLGEACIVFYSGMWYRALVYDQFENDLASVILVDTGKLATVDVVNLREIKEEWFATPLKCVPFKLFGLVVNEKSGINRRTLIDLLYESLCPKNDEPLHCSIKDTSQDCYSVEISQKGTRQCVYQNLIDSGYYHLDNIQCESQSLDSS